MCRRVPVPFMCRSVFGSATLPPLREGLAKRCKSGGACQKIKGFSNDLPPASEQDIYGLVPQHPRGEYVSVYVMYVVHTAAKTAGLREPFWVRSGWAFAHAKPARAKSCALPQDMFRCGTRPSASANGKRVHGFGSEMDDAYTSYSVYYVYVHRQRAAFHSNGCRLQPAAGRVGC